MTGLSRLIGGGSEVIRSFVISTAALDTVLLSADGSTVTVGAGANHRPSFAEIRSVSKDGTRYLNDIRPTNVVFEGSTRVASELVFNGAVLGYFQTQGLSIYWSGTAGSFDGGFSIENAPAASRL